MAKIAFPPLHKGQLEVFNHPAKFKTLACGRRWGKSFLAKQMALTRAIEQGQNVWLLYPTYKTALPHWREFTRMFNRDIPFVTYMSQQDRMIEFVGGGRVTIKSTDQPNNLRGDGLDFALLDEASFMQQQVWYEVVFPALADKGGDAIFISTPYGKGNWFYQLYLKGVGDNPEPNWKSWRMPTRSNPHIDRLFLREMKKDIPYHTYQQEILANFTDNVGGVFNNLEKVCTGKKLEEPIHNHVYIFGIDWGRKNDYTVISVFNRYTGEQVDLIRFSDIDYQRQLELVERAYLKWKPVRIIAEENNMGQVLVEQLKKDLAKYDVKLRPVYMTNIMKRALVEGLAIAIDKERIQLLDYTASDEARSQYEEMVSYELKRTAGGTQVTYSSPRSGHDDTVVATMLAVSDLKSKYSSSRTFHVGENPFY